MYLLQVKHYYDRPGYSDRYVKSVKTMEFDDVNKAIKRKHKEEMNDPGCYCRIFIDITDQKQQLRLDL